MNIEKSLSQAQTFAELLPIAQRAHAEVSFLGARYVHVNGYEGSLSLDALAERVEELVDENFEFDESERACGKEIASLIDRIYLNSDRALKDSFILTKLFNCIREGFANIFIYRCLPPVHVHL